MEGFTAIWKFLTGNFENIATVIAYCIAVASIIVKLTPTLKDDNYLKAFIKFIGKYIALDKYSPPKP